MAFKNLADIRAEFEKKVAAAEPYQVGSVQDAMALSDEFMRIKQVGPAADNVRARVEKTQQIADKDPTARLALEAYEAASAAIVQTVGISSRPEPRIAFSTADRHQKLSRHAKDLGLTPELSLAVPNTALSAVVDERNGAIGDDDRQAIFTTLSNHNVHRVLWITHEPIQVQEQPMAESLGVLAQTPAEFKARGPDALGKIEAFIDQEKTALIGHTGASGLTMFRQANRLDPEPMVRNNPDNQR